jgi:hypothetical protein
MQRPSSQRGLIFIFFVLHILPQPSNRTLAAPQPSSNHREITIRLLAFFVLLASHRPEELGLATERPREAKHQHELLLQGFTMLCLLLAAAQSVTGTDYEQ